MNLLMTKYSTTYLSGTTWEQLNSYQARKINRNCGSIVQPSAELLGARFSLGDNQAVFFYWFGILVEILQISAASRRFYSKNRFRATQISGNFQNLIRN